MIDDSRLSALGQFTPEGTLTSGYGDHYLFFVGRDDVHGILKYIIGPEMLAFLLNMFGYDDEELNKLLVDKMENPAVYTQYSLDLTQSKGVHEKQLLESDQKLDPVAFSHSFCILESATDQISHTKGGVLKGQGIWFEGSTNWSNAGEGTGIQLNPDLAKPKGFKAQNNTLLVSTNPVGLARFEAQLNAEHRIGLSQKHSL